MSPACNTPSPPPPPPHPTPLAPPPPPRAHLCPGRLPDELDDGDARARDGKHLAHQVGRLEQQLLKLLDHLAWGEGEGVGSAGDCVFEKGCRFAVQQVCMWYRGLDPSPHDTAPPITAPLWPPRNPETPEMTAPPTRRPRARTLGLARVLQALERQRHVDVVVVADAQRVGGAAKHRHAAARPAGAQDGCHALERGPGGRGVFCWRLGRPVGLRTSSETRRSRCAPWRRWLLVQEDSRGTRASAGLGLTGA